MVEIEGRIKDQPISILILLGASLSYVSPKTVELCRLQQDKFEKYWMVQLNTGTKWKVTNYVKNYEIMMNELNTHGNLNILPLGSYDLIVGMDWLEKHRVMLNCYDKFFTCLDDNGNIISVKAIPRKVTIREIYEL